MLEDVYRSFPRFLQHLQTQKTNIRQYQKEIGATDADLEDVDRDADVAAWLDQTCNLAVEFKETATGIKGRFFSNKPEPPAGAFMNAPPVTPPAAVNAGAVKRSRERDQRFLHAQGITQAAKIAMDLVGEESASINPDAVKPTVEGHSAATGYAGAVVIGNRHKSDFAEIFVQRAAGAKRERVGGGTGKAVNFTIDPTEPGKPEQLLVIVQLRKSNENYGQPSDPIYMTLNP